MTTYLTVRDLSEQLQRIDPDARVVLEVRLEDEDCAETQPLIDLDVRMCGRRYVALRG